MRSRRRRRRPAPGLRASTTRSGSRRQPPSIDGRLDDAAWKEGEWAGDFVQQLPVEGGVASQKTELKILYDDKNIYFAIRAYDDMSKVTKYPARRDGIVGDVVGVCFDSLFDKRSGFEFDLNAAGTKIDLVLTNEGWDTTWDAVWDGKVAYEADAWTAEFRIPLSQLALQPAGRPGVGHPLVAVDRPPAGGEPVQPHPAARHWPPEQLR